MRQTKNIYEHLEKQDIIPTLQRKGNHKAYIKLSLTPLYASYYFCKEYIL